MTSDKQKQIQTYTKTIQWIMIMFILLGLIIGMLNMVFIERFTTSTQLIIKRIYEIYEHEGRTLAVIISSVLTVKIVKLKRGEISHFRLINLISLSLSMLILYVIIPYAFDFLGLYPLIMPLPWSTAPFQIAQSGNYFSISYQSELGSNGIHIALIVVAIYHVITIIGTLLIGRRWHCSMICTFNGGHAESAGEALPLKPLNKKRINSKSYPPKINLVLIILQIFMFTFNIFLIILWIDILGDNHTFISQSSLLALELNKYLIFELFLLFLFWVTLGGRSYCRYCAAGTMIGLLSQLSGQEITTGLTKCVQCGLCNDACKMSIDIMMCAKEGKPVKSINCVGCGLCIEACIHKNLQYSTFFLKKIQNSKKKKP